VRLDVLPSGSNSAAGLPGGLEIDMRAPRLLGLSHLKQYGSSHSEQPLDVTTVIGARHAEHLRCVIAADPALGGNSKTLVRARKPHPLRALLRRWTGRG